MESADSPAVLLLNLPDSALAGIDLLSFTTTKRFRGVKNLPPGLHFAYVGSSTAFSERHGIWFSISGDVRKPNVVVNKWDISIEALVVETDPSEVLRWRANLGSIWQEGLTPYRQAAPKTSDADGEPELNDWPTLTSCISSVVLSKITGRESSWTLSSASSSRRDLEEIPGITTEDLNFEAEKELNFLPINLKQTWRDGATGRERTDAAQDRSWALNRLVETACTDQNVNEIIGELQFCFLMVLTINNFSCLEQWKRILSLILTCKDSVARIPDLFIAAIAALRLQLQHCKDAEGGLIDLTEEGGSLLKKLLVRFRKGLEGLDQITVQDVVDELDDLESYLNQEHGWQFGGTFVKSGVLELEDGEQVRMDTTAFDEDDESGEFAPQIVDLTPAQRTTLGLENEIDLPASLMHTSLKDLETSVDGSESPMTSDSDDRSEWEEGDLEDMDARY